MGIITSGLVASLTKASAVLSPTVAVAVAAIVYIGIGLMRVPLLPRSAMVLEESVSSYQRHSC